MKKWMNIFIILIGFVLILNSSVISITGYIVNENIQLGGSILGLVFLVIGLVLFLTNQDKGLEKKVDVVKTKKFLKSIKNHPKDKINRALKKLGTGLAKEEYLKYENMWSLRVSKGGRIFYERTPEQIILQKYKPSSKHG